jgi:histidine phosphotransfer protein HptB
MEVKEASFTRTPRHFSGCSTMTLPFQPSPGPVPSSEPAAAPDAPVLDPAALATLAQLDPTGANRLMPRVLTTYRTSLARLLAQLALARTQSDAATMRLVAHTLKSSSASVGALTLSALCGDAERALREGRLDTVPALLDQLVAESARVDAAVLQHLAGAP